MRHSETDYAVSNNLMIINYKRCGRKRSWYNFNYLGLCQNWM